ncbi:MAG: hypothetical protein H6Q70_3608 [Firmicutes bacterium]|nr:hypothetical protein [Bacillota bacterium]
MSVLAGTISGIEARILYNRFYDIKLRMYLHYDKGMGGDKNLSWRHSFTCMIK